MVFLGVGEERVAAPESKSMEMGTKRSMPLHNFTFPCLKWGSQRYMRCMNATTDAAGGVSSSGDRRSPSSKSNDSTASRKRELEPPVSARGWEKRTRITKSRINDDDGEEGIEAVREKLMHDLKTAADRMKDAILRKEVASEEEEEEEEEEQESQPKQAATAAPAGEMPWNLRTRRAACKAPVAAGGSGKGLKIEEKKPDNQSPLRSDAAVKSPKLRSTSEKTKRAKFSVALSKKEIEEDFMAMVGHRPPRRPKKRPKMVQQDLDGFFPGLYLTEVTVDSYRVPEAPVKGKR